MNLFKRYKDELVAILLLALPFFFLRTNLSDPSRATFLDKALMKVSAQVQWLAVKVARGASSFIEEYVYLVEVQRENQRLSYENARLSQQVDDLTRLERENERLRALLSLRDDLPAQKISARVIAKDISPLFRVLRIRLDRGRDDRVQPGMPVVATDGLVGQIARVAEDYAEVTLTVDEASAVDVVMERTGSRGILRGTGESDSYKARIQYLLRADEVHTGDIVLTSGLGKRFPAHLKVGTIANVEKRNFGLWQQAEVTPSVNFSKLEEVFVLTETSAKTASTARGPKDGGPERGAGP